VKQFRSPMGKDVSPQLTNADVELMNSGDVFDLSVAGPSCVDSIDMNGSEFNQNSVLSNRGKLTSEQEFRELNFA
jgi:hypothetical protein